MSTTGGASWKEIDRSMKAYDFHLGNSLYVAGGILSDATRLYGMALRTSTDDGTTWSLKTLLTENSYAYAVWPHPTDANIVYVGGERNGSDGQYSVLLKTTNKGATWTRVGEPLLAQHYDRIRFIEGSKSDPNRLYVATYNGLHVTTDGGTSWTTVIPQSVSALTLDPSDGRNVFAATSAGVRMSTDGGHTWSDLAGGLTSNSVEALEFDPVNKVLYAGTANAGVFRRILAAAVHADEEPIPSRFQLFQNYPNPFNPGTAISYRLSAMSEVRLTVYDVLGRSVAPLEDGMRQAGLHMIQWDASGLPSGVYLYELRVGQFCQSRRMVLVR
jgi:hypothetical protein